MQALWWTLFAISVPLYLFIAGFVMPKIFFKEGYNVLFSRDRGLKNYKEAGGRTIVYEPAPEYRKYIKQYILSERRGKKIIICKPDESITYLDYDIVLFNDRSSAFKVINVTERIEKPGYSHITGLPAKAAYIALVVNRANNVNLGGAARKTSKKRLAVFAAACLFAVTLEAFFVKLCFARLFGGIFAEDFMSLPETTLITIAVSVAAAAVNFIAAAWYINRKSKKTGAAE